MVVLRWGVMPRTPSTPRPHSLGEVPRQSTYPAPCFRLSALARLASFTSARPRPLSFFCLGGMVRTSLVNAQRYNQPKTPAHVFQKKGCSLSP